MKQGDMNEFERRLLATGCTFAVQESMSKHTTFAIGGAARFFVRPTSSEQLMTVLRIAGEAGVPCMMLGRGSNLLFSDQGFAGVIVATSALRNMEVISSDDSFVQISAECGVTLRELANFAADRALTGLEFLHGIPGSVGGALRMNAGAYGKEIGALVRCVRCFNRATGEVETFPADRFVFAHRHSLLAEREELICLSATFVLPSPPMEETEACKLRDRIRATMEELRERRWATQPLDLPSAGSIFKRPNGHFAGKLIEDCGLKGMRIGGAQISPKHAGFIVNVGGATAQDVCSLIEVIKSTVLERFGVALEQEVVYVGTKPEE